MGIGVTRFSQNALNPQVQLQPLRLAAVVGEDSRQRKTSNSRFTGKHMVGFGANPGEWVCAFSMSLMACDGVYINASFHRSASHLYAL